MKHIFRTRVYIFNESAQTRLRTTTPSYADYRHYWHGFSANSKFSKQAYIHISINNPAVKEPGQHVSMAQPFLAANSNLGRESNGADMRLSPGAIRAAFAVFGTAEEGLTYSRLVRKSGRF